MDNGINKVAAQSQPDLKKLAMYAEGYELKPSDGTGAGAGTASLFIGGKAAADFKKLNNVGINLFKKENQTKLKKGFSDHNTSHTAEQQSYKDAFAGKKGAKGYYQGADEALRRKNINVLEETVTSRKKKNLYHSNTRQLIRDSKGLSGDALKTQMAEINKTYAQEKLNILNSKKTGTLKPTTKLGKTGQFISKYSGYEKVSEKVLTKAAEGSKFWGKTVSGLSKMPKGTGIAAAAQGIIEAPTVYNTYKELGAGKGTKQLAKSGAKVAATAVGYAAGAKAGAIIGSGFAPVVGTIIGAGLGILCAWGLSKLTSKVVGKDELAKAHEKTAEKLAKEAEQDPAKKAELLEKAQARMTAEGVDITKPKGDAKEILKDYNEEIGKVSEEQKESSVKIGDYKQTFADLKELHDFMAEDHFLIKIA